MCVYPNYYKKRKNFLSSQRIRMSADKFRWQKNKKKVTSIITITKKMFNIDDIDVNKISL